MRKRLVKCIFTILLFAGVIGLYLAFYGPFKISLIGFSIAAIIAVRFLEKLKRFEVPDGNGHDR